MMKYIFLLLSFFPLVFLTGCGDRTPVPAKAEEQSAAVHDLIEYVPENAFAVFRQILTADNTLNEVLKRSRKRSSVMPVLELWTAGEERQGDSILFLYPDQNGSVRFGAVVRFKTPCVPAILKRIQAKLQIPEILIEGKSAVYSSSGRTPGNPGILLIAEAPDQLQIQWVEKQEDGSLFRPETNHFEAIFTQKNTPCCFVIFPDRMPEKYRQSFFEGHAVSDGVFHGVIVSSDSRSLSFQLFLKDSHFQPGPGFDVFCAKLIGEKGGKLEKLPGGGILYSGTFSKKEDQYVHRCNMKLLEIFKALKEYAAEHNGAFPAESGLAGLEELRKTVLPTSRLYVCPIGNAVPAAVYEPLTARNTSYFYFGGLKSNEKLPILIEFPSVHPDGTCAVLESDGTLRRMENPGDALDARLKKALGHAPVSDREKLLLEQTKTWVMNGK